MKNYKEIKKELEGFKERIEKGEANQKFLLEILKLDDEATQSYFWYKLSDDEFFQFEDEIQPIEKSVRNAIFTD